MCNNNRFDYIDYEGKLYPYLWLEIPNWGIYRVSTSSLSNALMENDLATYKSEEARHIDEMFFFFVEDEDFQLSDEEIIDVILRAVT